MAGSEDMSKTSKTARRRLSDRSKGFAYFETFDEIAQWDDTDVDALQRANTPLFPRSSILPSLQDGRTNVMLVHDYAGGYKNYEACQGAVVPERMYSCEYLRFVETFVYFSHKLVSIPPPTWTNSCHRNGVKVLGTFLVEPGSRNVESILEQTQGVSWLARKLAAMAKSYGFDGWLINIETRFPLASWNADRLVAFLEQLRHLLGPASKVVWYDGLTVLNLVWYQNTLNSVNLRFAKAAGSILTNYAWTPQLALGARQTALLNGIPPENVYIGIDVWAQNEQKGRNRRVTYPVKGGGGTGTGLGMEEIARLGLATGIFGPAWSFEHFPGYGSDVEDTIWKGTLLRDDIKCDCPDRNVHTEVSYRANPITKYALRYPAGTDTFFYTNFRRCFESGNAKSPLASHLGHIGVLPTGERASLLFRRGNSRLQQPLHGSISADLHRTLPKCCVSVSLDSLVTQNLRPDHGLVEITGRLVLFDLGITGTTDREASVTFSKPAISDMRISFFVESLDTSHSVGLPSTAVDHGTASMPIPFSNSPAAVVCGIEVKFHGVPEVFAARNSPILDLFNIKICPIDTERSRAAVVDAWIESRREGGLRQRRLCWLISNGTDVFDRPGHDMPVSATTGLFSHFTVCKDGKLIGTAFSLEFVLDDASAFAIDKCTDVEFDIVGFGFDGQLLSKRKLSVCERAGVSGCDDWVIVDAAEAMQDHCSV